MISVFSSLKLTSIAWDPISTIRYEVFKRINPKDIIYWTDVDEVKKCEGAIRKIPCKFKNKYLRFLERIYWMRKLKPDIILLICAPLDFLFYLLKPPKSKVIVHLNGFPPAKRFTSLNLLLYNLNLFLHYFLIKRADTIITVSHYVKNQILHLQKPSKIFVISNGVNSEFFNPKLKNRDFLFQKYKIPQNKPLISYVGALIKIKRPQFVIEIAKLHKDKIFVIVGRESQELKDFSRKIKNINNIIWIPYMERKDIAILLASSDILIAPFLYEGFGLVVIEAQSAGCCVIASEHGALPEIIKNETSGILVKTGDEKIEIGEFEEKINFLLKNQKLKERIIKNALTEVKNNFDWNKISKKWAKVLINAASQSGNEK